jgi:hypothetical protein
MNQCYNTVTQLAGLEYLNKFPPGCNIRTTRTEETRADIYASSKIRTHDPSVWADEDRVAIVISDIYG